MADRSLHVRVVSPDRVVHESDASALVVPAWDGKLGVLPGHAPFLGLLGAGEFVVDLPGGGSRRFHVAGGVLKIEKDEVTVLTEYAGEVPPEEIPPEAVIHPEEVSALAGNPLV